MFSLLGLGLGLGLYATPDNGKNRLTRLGLLVSDKKIGIQILREIDFGYFSGPKTAKIDQIQKLSLSNCQSARISKI